MSEAPLASEGPGAPPRDNGELVFREPWESRLFGLTMALFEAGRFAWPDFQSRLIAAIARHETELAEAGTGEYHYYACWLEAFRTLAADEGWLDGEGLAALERELAARPHGHDHR